LELLIRGVLVQSSRGQHMSICLEVWSAASKSRYKPSHRQWESPFSHYKGGKGRGIHRGERKKKERWLSRNSTSTNLTKKSGGWTLESPFSVANPTLSSRLLKDDCTVNKEKGKRKKKGVVRQAGRSGRHAAHRRGQKTILVKIQNGLSRPKRDPNKKNEVHDGGVGKKKGEKVPNPANRLPRIEVRMTPSVGPQTVPSWERQG